MEKRIANCFGESLLKKGTKTENQLLPFCSQDLRHETARKKRPTMLHFQSTGTYERNKSKSLPCAQEYEQSRDETKKSCTRTTSPPPSTLHLSYPSFFPHIPSRPPALRPTPHTSSRRRTRIPTQPSSGRSHAHGTIAPRSPSSLFDRSQCSFPINRRIQALWDKWSRSRR